MNVSGDVTATLYSTSSNSPIYSVEAEGGNYGFVADGGAYAFSAVGGGCRESYVLSVSYSAPLLRL